MKYIRTKNGKVYEVSQGIFGEYPIDKDGNVLKMPFAKCEIAKQSNTIEELCDEFVFIDVGIRQDKKYIFQSLKKAESKDFLYDKCYGAIWTNKGLIYVAKMNSKGEFELL